MKLYKYLGLLSIVCFSFFYTEKIATLTLENNEIYKTIEEVKDNYAVAVVNATIDGDYITPGLNGQNVNVKKSYYKMKAFDVFNEYYLVYNIIRPLDSINNHMDKIITRGNSDKKSIAFVIDNNESIINYCIVNNIPASILVNLNTFNSDIILEQLNNDVNNYNKLDVLLNRYHKNTNICYINDEIEPICRHNHKFLVRSLITVDNNSFINVKNNIEYGDIYYINKNLSLENMKLLLKSIAYKDAKIVFLSQLISEDRD